MENFCWEWDVLSEMTAHVDTGEPLPRELFDRMLAARNFQSGLATIGQVESGLFDMLLHSAYDPAGRRRKSCAARSVLDVVRREIAVARGLPTTASCTRSRTFSPAATPGWIRLQSGCGALRGRLRRVRGGRRAVAGRRRPFPRRGARAGRQSRRDGVVRGSSRTGAPTIANAPGTTCSRGKLLLPRRMVQGGQARSLENRPLLLFLHA